MLALDQQLLVRVCVWGEGGWGGGGGVLALQDRSVLLLTARIKYKHYLSG